MYLTQNQIDVLKQNLRKKRIKLELLNYDFKIIDSIEGEAINGSLTATADNPIRRSGQIEIAIPINPDAARLIDQLDGFTIESGGKIWLDKYIKIYVGIDDISSSNSETTWYNMGIYLINAPERLISGGDFRLSFECVDLMAKLTGLRQGQLTGMATTIPFGYYDENGEFQRTLTRDALISVITELGGFSRYEIYPIPETKKYLPYEIKVGIGSTVYDILQKFLDILATWQIYFDDDGVLIIEPIPNGENAIIYDVAEEQYISDSMNCDFSNVKNQVVIYGRLNTLTYYAENSEEHPSNVEYSGNSLILKYETINTETLNIGGTTFGFHSLNSPNSNIINNVKIYSGNTLLLDGDLVKFENSKSLFGVDYSSSQIEIGMFEPDEIYFIRIFSATQFKNSSDMDEIDLSEPIVFEFMGKQQVSYNLVNDNKDSPFYINNNLGSPNYYAGLAKTPQGNNQGEGYELTINDEDSPITSLLDGTLITFQANALNSYASGSDFTFINIKSSSGDILVSNIPLVQDIWELNEDNESFRPYVSQSKIDKDYTIWLLKFEDNEDGGQFVLVGRNPNALTLVLSGGEFDNIYADQLAYERCILELFNHSNMNNNITINVVPNYLLNVNCKIVYSHNAALPKNIYSTKPFIVASEIPSNEILVTAYNNEVFVKGDKEYYLTKSVTYPLGVDTTTQTITAIQIYDSGNLIGSDYKN